MGEKQYVKGRVTTEHEALKGPPPPLSLSLSLSAPSFFLSFLLFSSFLRLFATAEAEVIMELLQATPRSGNGISIWSWTGRGRGPIRR